MNINLDDWDALKKIDSAGMLETVCDFPSQWQQAMALCRDWQFQSFTPSNIVILGLGGSAIGGDLIRVYLAPVCPVPIFTCRAYEVPAYVDSHSLVLAASYSGNTEETLSAYAQAKAKDAHIIAYSTGGKLQQYAQHDTVPHFMLPSGYQPRAALAFAFIALLTTLQQLGLIPPQAGELQQTYNVLQQLRSEWHPEQPCARNLPKSLALSLTDKIPVIYGSQGAPEVIAYRWKCQMNENAKVLAAHHSFPELNHNETVGWSGSQPHYDKFAVVILRDPGDPPRIQKRIDLTREVISRHAKVTQIYAWGQNALAKIFSLIYLGDLASVYLALAQGLNPTPVTVIEWLKGELAKI